MSFKLLASLSLAASLAAACASKPVPQIDALQHENDLLRQQLRQSEEDGRTCSDLLIRCQENLPK